MSAMPITLKEIRALERPKLPPRLGLRAIIFAIAIPLTVLAALAFSVSARAEEAVKGELKVSTENGFTRLVFRLDQQVDAKATMSGAILVISFKKPVAIDVDRINASAPELISAARRDPDKTAIRIALSKKVKLNVIPAAERYYVDLLPEDWSGVLPGLPQEVVEELALRARNAERQLQQQKLVNRQRQSGAIRVKVAKQPTFMRYIFELPASVNVIPDKADGRLTLTFDQPLEVDLADARATLPDTLGSIENEKENDTTSITFVLNGTPTIRSFREEKSVVVDVGLNGAKPKSAVEQVNEQAAAAQAAATPKIDAPETVVSKEDPGEQAKAELPKIESKAEAPKPAEAKAAQVAPAQQAAKSEPVKEAPKEAPKVETAKPETPKAEEKKAEAAKPEEPRTEAPKAEAPKAEEAQQPAEAKEPPKLAERPARPAANADSPVTVEIDRVGDNVRLNFPFVVATPAAAFRRADMLWLVFDSNAKVDLNALNTDPSRTIRSSQVTRGADGEAIVRIRLDRPKLASILADGPGWIVTIGDSVPDPTKPLGIARNIVGKNRASITIPFEEPRALHQISDPDVGDRLMVITAMGPARGFLKPQEFVELRTLASTHGVVIQPLADDVSAEVAVDKITVTRPGGLTISAAAMGTQVPGSTNWALTFDTQQWGFDRQAPFNDRQSELMRLAAMSPAAKRNSARINLARFYLARDMASEAKAVLDVALADAKGGNEEVTGSVLKAVANVMLDRPDEALKILSAPQIGNQRDAPIWRAIAFAREGRWADARAAFKSVENAMAALPIELQRMAMQDAIRAMIETRDFAAAAKGLTEFETLGVPAGLEPYLSLLGGRLDEGLGRTEAALNAYRLASESKDRRAAAQGRLREIVLRNAMGDMKPAEVIGELEMLTTTWRGDETEIEGLKLLAHLYTMENRYRDAFHVMRTAMMSHANSDMTRQIQDEAAVSFESLFLAGKGDAMPAIEALGLFYDYRELVPIGRRGDEMIRKLTDRLVAVDLLDQAAELLQHQVDHRLQGAARAQVATRLAVIYLMNHKPDRALQALRASRIGDLANELRDQRLLLEARAMSETGRHDVALEVIEKLDSREATRLRGDIYWASQRWRECAEQIELYYGERWKEFTPLNDSERSDILRAAIGYALADEPISVRRLSEKYAAKMAEGPDRRAFEIVSTPVGTNGADFKDVAKSVASVDTLNAFLADMKARYPDSSATSSGETKELEQPAKPEAAAPRPDVAKAAAPKTTGPGKPDKGASVLPPKVPEGVKLKPDTQTTGSISRQPARRPVAQGDDGTLGGRLKTFFSR
jgi:hypothetical protein